MKTINYAYLENFNAIVDCKCPGGCRDTIADELLSLDYKSIPTYLQLRYLYIVGKFHFHQSRIKDKLSNLEKSNEYFDQVFIVAKSAGVEVRSPKQYFKRAHTKFILSQHVTHQEDVAFLQEKATEITQEALTKFENNSSIQWLQEQLIINL